MDANTTTPLDHEPDADQALLHEEEELSSGNGRLAIIVGVILAVVVLGYVLLPAQTTRRIASAMPIMELGEATVTGTREKEAPAAPTEEVTSETPDAAKAVAAPAAKPATARAAVAAPEEAPLATPEAEPIAVEPVPAAAPVVEEAPANVTLSGRILDENGRPLAGATVMLKGSRKATGTDANGNYSLEVPAGDNTLVYGYGGYEDHEVRTRSTQPQNVTLTPREDGKRRRR